MPYGTKEKIYTCSSKPEVGLPVKPVAPKSCSLWTVGTTLTYETTHTFRHIYTLEYTLICSLRDFLTDRMNTNLSGLTGQSSVELFFSWH